jgi:hypothetical protein
MGRSVRVHPRAGVEVISDIDLAPTEETNDVGTSHTLTATVATNGAPVVGTTVTFTVVDGPHVGVTGTGVSDSSGNATFSYIGTIVGTDTIEATFVDSAGRTQRSNRVLKHWVEAPPATGRVEGKGQFRSAVGGTDFRVDATAAGETFLFQASSRHRFNATNDQELLARGQHRLVPRGGHVERRLGLHVRGQLRGQRVPGPQRHNQRDGARFRRCRRLHERRAPRLRTGNVTVSD